MNNESLIKFSQLPGDVRHKISSQEYMEILRGLEMRYNVKLSMVMIMIVVGDLRRHEIDQYLVENFDISAIDAKKIKLEIIQKVLNDMPSYFFLEVEGEASEAPLDEEDEMPENEAEEADGEEARAESVQADAILREYIGDEGEYEKIEKEEDRLANAAGDNIRVLRQEFLTAVQKKNILKSIAALKVLAKNDDIGKFLHEEEQMKKFLSSIWEEQHGQLLVNEFLEDSDKPKFIQMFLEYVLGERLGLSERDAARTGAQIGNIYKKIGRKEFSQLAYFDAEAGEFRWMRNW